MTCKLLTRLLLIFVAGLSVVSCNDNPFKPIDESESNDSFIVTMPRGILETRAINQENLTVEVTVNGVALTPTQDDGTTTVAATIDQGEQLLIEVNWFEQFENRPLQLASLSEVFPVVRDGERIQLDADNYDTSQFDDDNDTESNLLERRNGTDPFDSTSSTARGVEPTTAPPNVTEGAQNDDPLSEPLPVVSIPAPDPSQDCEGTAGTDAISGDDNWDNNCELGRFLPHSNSNYTRGVQRIIGCTGVAEGDDAQDDAQFGPRTERAVEAYQSSRTLPIDGFVGEMTWASLREELELIDQPVTTSTHVIEIWAVRGASCTGESQFFRNTEPVTGDVVNWGMAILPGDGISDQVEFSVFDPTMR